MENERLNHLEELDHSDFKIAEDQPNIDNWKILDTSGKKIGKVKDLLFDREAMKVRYIITNLKNGDLLQEDRDVLIPIGHAQLDRENERVVVPNIDRDKLAAIPVYHKAEDITREEESKIRNSFAGSSKSDYDNDNFYDHEDYDEDRFYTDGIDNDDRDQPSGKVGVIEEHLEVGKKTVNTGGKRISSRVVERPAEEKVKLREEHVHVNRNPVDRKANVADLENYKNQTIEEHETSEVPVIKKEARVVEEVSLEKDVETREEVIKENVRRTQLDIDDLEGDGNFSGRDKHNLDRNQDNDFTGNDRELGSTGTGRNSGMYGTESDRDSTGNDLNRDRNFKGNDRNKGNTGAGTSGIAGREHYQDENLPGTGNRKFGNTPESGREKNEDIKNRDRSRGEDSRNQNS